MKGVSLTTSRYSKRNWPYGVNVKNRRSTQCPHLPFLNALVSSGTIARLIGSARYEDIELAHGRFLVWLQEQPAVMYDTWVDAWDAYKKLQTLGSYRFFNNRCTFCKDGDHMECEITGPSGEACDCGCRP